MRLDAGRARRGARPAWLYDHGPPLAAPRRTRPKFLCADAGVPGRRRGAANPRAGMGYAKGVITSEALLPRGPGSCGLAPVSQE